MVVLGGCWLDKTKLIILISTQVEDVVKVWSEKVLKMNFHGWVGGGWWLDQVEIRLSQLSTKLKLKLSLAELVNFESHRHMCMKGKHAHA